MSGTTGLVVGKFCPLHFGHDHVILTALAESDRVVIITYTSEFSAQYPAATRRMWLENLYPTATVLAPEYGFPPDDAPAIAHRQYCRALLKALDIDVDTVYGSDSYIPGFADFLCVGARMVDAQRKKVPISGTALRTFPGMMENFTSSIVRHRVPTRVLFIGGESSGKTTLCERLSISVQSSEAVYEYGRELYAAKNQTLLLSDMEDIAIVQVQREQAAMAKDLNFIFCDTSPLVTKFYSGAWYDSVSPHLRLLAQRQYDYVFLCQRDFPFVNDGTRADEEFAIKQQQYYSKQLKQPFTLLSGSISDRMNTVVDTIGAMP